MKTLFICVHLFWKRTSVVLLKRNCQSLIVSWTMSALIIFWLVLSSENITLIHILSFRHILSCNNKNTSQQWNTQHSTQRFVCSFPTLWRYYVTIETEFPMFNLFFDMHKLVLNYCLIRSLIYNYFEIYFYFNIRVSHYEADIFFLIYWTYRAHYNSFVALIWKNYTLDFNLYDQSKQNIGNFSSKWFYLHIH